MYLSLWFVAVKEKVYPNAVKQNGMVQSFLKDIP